MGFIIYNTFVGTKALTSLQISLNKPRLRRLQELEEHEIHLKFGLKKSYPPLFRYQQQKLF